MSKRRETIKDRCERCAINISMCFCDIISPLHTETKTSIILHLKEYYLTSNTGRIANLCLENSDYYIRGKINEPIEAEFSENGQYEPYYLYPSEEAEVLDQNFLNKRTKPIHLIVPDATWRQAKKFHKREPSLLSIPHLKLPSTGGSIYELRKQKNEEGLCTIEAIAQAIGIIEGANPRNHLLEVLKVMNERVMRARAKR
jgi:DTW domain-containing protein YfiP